MKTAVRHLYLTYRWLYVWFWGIAALAMAGIAASFEIFGHYTLGDDRVSVWETVGAQGPRWFLFAMGIMFATVTLPVVIANGITRRVYFRGTMLFAVASSVVFGLMMLAGYGFERVVYTANGMMAGLTNYPMTSWGQAARYGVDVSIALLAFMLSGWLIGLMFYRLQVWVAMLLLPLAIIPIAGGLATGYPKPWLLGTPLAVAVILATVAVSYLLAKSVAVKPKKA